jgi:hypothetical protein
MEPRRQGSPRHIQQGSPHHSRQGSPHRSRQGSPHPSRQGSPHRSVRSPPQRAGSSGHPVGSLATSSCHPGSQVSITVLPFIKPVPSTSSMSFVKPLDVVQDNISFIYASWVWKFGTESILGNPTTLDGQCRYVFTYFLTFRKGCYF